jgi:hypothetical protein
MSLQTARFEGEQIVNSFNLFVDSEKTNLLAHGNNKGDALDIHLEGNSIEAYDGEIIRLSLTDFTMFNNVYNVNINNSKFRFSATKADGTSYSLREVVLSHKNYKNLSDLATEFASALQTQLLAAATAFSGNTDITTTPVVVTPALVSSQRSDEADMSETGNRLFSALFTFQGAHLIDSIQITANENDGDFYALLGGLRLDNDPNNANTTHQSFKLDIKSETIKIEGFFPMQRQTDPNIYLRCGAVNNGLEMSALSRPVAGADGFKRDVLNSDILAKIPKQDELIKFTTNTNEFFVNLQQRRLSTLRLFLTDKNSRPLGRLINDRRGTAAGLENSSTGEFESSLQSTLGNLFFTAVIKIEILKVRNPKLLEAPDPPKPLPARLAQAPYQKQDYGAPRY